MKKKRETRKIEKVKKESKGKKETRLPSTRAASATGGQSVAEATYKFPLQFKYYYYEHFSK
jgi:hypothetical protein